MLTLPEFDGHFKLAKNDSRRSIGVSAPRLPEPVNIEPLIIIALCI